MKLVSSIKKSLIYLTVVPLLSVAYIHGDVVAPVPSGVHNSGVTNPSIDPNAVKVNPSSVQDVKNEQKDGVKIEKKDGIRDTENRVKVESKGDTNPSVKTDVKVIDKTPSPVVPK